VLATVPVFGVGSGPQLAFGVTGSPVAVGKNLLSPAGVAVDGAGDVYISDIGLQEVFKVTPSGAQSTVGSGFGVPEAVAVDGAGNVYIADSFADAVFKVTPGGVQTTVGGGFDFPAGVAVDGAGNVYVSDPFIVGVFKITPGGAQTMVGSGFNTPVGLAVDAQSNVYVADSDNAAVYKVTPGGLQTTVGTGLISPAAVAVDAAGDVYITDDGNGTLYEVTPNGVQIVVASGLNVPDVVAVDGTGNLDVANSFSSQVIKFDRADSPSLSFDHTKVGSTSADSPKTLGIQNIGNAALNFSALTFPADFPAGTLEDVGECTSIVSLEAADSCALIIEFKPVTPLGTKSSAALTETVKVTTNDLNETKSLQQVSVTGTELPAN
jgi:sugar lactone lactonase YvrE